MNNLSKIVHGATILTLLGGGDSQQGDLDAALAHAPILLAVDGGANRALDWGVRPAAVIGDFDSVDHARVAAEGVPFLETPDQNFPDFDKALQLAGNRMTLCVGFLGGRLDHHLAAISALSRAPGPAILIGAQDVAAIVPARIGLNLPASTRLSLWPLVPTVGRSTGLRWPIDGLALDPTGRIGTSNEASGGAVSITIDSGELLLILPRDHLSALVSALS